MSARAASAAATRDRIIDAAQAAFMAKWYDDVTIRGIAADAGVAVQTVLNHFPTKEALYAAATERLASSIEAVRFAVEPGDVGAAIRVLVEDYERTGDSTMRKLAVEERVPAVQPWIALGRKGHESWVERTFPEALRGLRGARRTRRRAQLVVATDVYTWKLLRRDKCLSRTETVTAMCELVLALHQPIRKGTEE